MYMVFIAGMFGLLMGWLFKREAEYRKGYQVGREVMMQEIQQQTQTNATFWN